MSSHVGEDKEEDLYIRADIVVPTNSHKRRIEQSRALCTLQRKEGRIGQGIDLDVEYGVVVVDDDVETAAHEDIETRAKAQTDSKVTTQDNTELFVHTYGVPKKSQ